MKMPFKTMKYGYEIRYKKKIELRFDELIDSK